MLLVIAVLSLLGASAVVLHWARTRVDALGRVRGFPVISVGLALTVAVSAGVPVVRHELLERRLSQVSSTISGVPMTVHCDTLGDAWVQSHPELGFVRTDADGRPEPHATISWEACAAIRSWRSSDRAEPTRDQVIAVHVVTHEAMHVAGLMDEAQAECAAVQRDVRTASALGATAAQAERLARLYWRTVYPELTPEYRSAWCGPDTDWDEHLPGAPWRSVKA